LNILDLKSTLEHLLHMVVLVIAAGIAAAGLVTLVCLYLQSVRRALRPNPRRRRTPSAQASLVDENDPIS
jgi:hypothetical protein